jgi:hypothetical protein
MSNNAPRGDSLTHKLAKIRSAAEAIERLAAEYHTALRPMREALEAVAGAPLEDRDRWAGAVSALARVLSENGMANEPATLEGIARWGLLFDAGHLGRAFSGRAFCTTLAAVIADGSPPAGFFATPDQHTFITTKDATQEIRDVLRQLLHVHTDHVARKFTERYGAILAEAGMNGGNLRHQLAQCGKSLSDEAATAIYHWDECSSGVPIYRVQVRPAADCATANDMTERITPCEQPSEPAQFARFCELHALATATAPEHHDVPLATQDEYQRLLTRFGVFTVDGVFVGPPDPTQVPNSDPILNTDCIPIACAKPLICPRSSPKLPVELLPQVETRFRGLRLVGPDQTILWVGRQARMDTLCMYHNGCTCFNESALIPPNGTKNDGNGPDPTRPGEQREARPKEGTRTMSEKTPSVTFGQLYIEVHRHESSRAANQRLAAEAKSPAGSFFAGQFAGPWESRQHAPTASAEVQRFEAIVKSRWCLVTPENLDRIRDEIRDRIQCGPEVVNAMSLNDAADVLERRGGRGADDALAPPASSAPALVTNRGDGNDANAPSAAPHCPGCGSPPAALDVNDICPNCGAYHFDCGTTKLPVSGPGNAVTVQLHSPLWHRIPPSLVRKPGMIASDPPATPQNDGNSAAVQVADADSGESGVPTKPADEKPPMDESAFVPMSDVWDQEFKSAALCSRFLDKHPEIRQRKPSPNRRDVYLPDWHRYWRQQQAIQSEALGDEAMQEHIADIEARKATERAKRGRATPDS